MPANAARAPAPRSTAAPSAAGDEAAEALALYQRLQKDADVDSPLGHALKRGITVCRDALRLYGPDRVVASFNGGKDAVVILHLMRAALAAHNEVTGGSSRMRIIFFEVADEFPEVEAFVHDSIARHDLVGMRYQVGFADGLRQCIEEHGSQAFVLGTREDDPNAKGQQDFCPSSDWMPPFMRVNPILTWTYGEVWAFLRTYSLPYCSLYDDGYTSLGKTTNTARNPALLRPDGTYGAAWELADGSLERAGRTASKPKAAPAEAAAGAEAAAAAAAAEGRLKAEHAALVIVGDEILGGKQTDANTLVAARRLRAVGCSLRRVSVVPDEIDEIVSELRRLCARHEVVFTSGGLGPTHDDVTLKAVAEALGTPMRRSEPMASLIRSKYAASGKELAPEVLAKMSVLPQGAQLRVVPGEPDAWPILQCGQIFVLPGVPAFFASKLTTICAHFLVGRPPVLARRLLLASPEEAIVQTLNDVVAAHPAISFGSYPVSEGAVSTIITLEGEGGADEAIEAALAALLGALPAGALADVEGAVSSVAELRVGAVSGATS